MFDNMFSGVVGRIASGKCRLSVNGRIAIQTSSGYKTYNPKTGSLTNCSNFVLDIADDWFMLIPTRKLTPGDIIINNGKPVYVLENKSKNRVEVMNYEDSTIETIVPERHALLGRKFYGKIVSLMGKGFGAGKGGFFKNMLKLKMMSSMLGGKGTGGEAFGGNALPMLMLMGGGSMDGLFDGICDDTDDEDEPTDIAGLFSDETEDDDDDELITLPEKTAKKTVKKTAKKAVKKTAKRK